MIYWAEGQLGFFRRGEIARKIENQVDASLPARLILAWRKADSSAYLERIRIEGKDFRGLGARHYQDGA
jgi:hypothetical protein